MKAGNEMNLLEVLEKAMEEMLDGMGSVKNNRVKADLKEAIEEVDKTINNLKEASGELHFYTYAGLANMYEKEEREAIYSSLEELTHEEDIEIKMLAHELIAKTIYLEIELKNHGLSIKERMEEEENDAF